MASVSLYRFTADSWPAWGLAVSAGGCDCTAVWVAVVDPAVAAVDESAEAEAAAAVDVLPALAIESLVAAAPGLLVVALVPLWLMLL